MTHHHGNGTGALALIGNGNITDSTFKNNSAGRAMAGAVYLQYGKTFYSVNSTYSQNFA
jgi:hypothetical protein